MAVHIERIAVENMGPAGEQDVELGVFNLFYGLNETGKTFLVEFLLRSLFRNASEWSLRELPGQGLVTVRGLAAEPIEFRPAENRRKLEDFWDERDNGLPSNMARLLVVKGGELAMDAEVAGGVGRDMLKTALSRDALLDQILEPILKTTQEARVEAGRILGDQRGELKRRGELLDHLRQLNELFEAVEDRYSQGPTRALELQVKEVEEELSRQRLARRHHSYELHQRRLALQNKRAELPDEELDELQATLREHRGETGELTRLEKVLGEKRAASEHYPWLAQAVGIWESRDLEREPRAPLLVGLIGLAVGATGLVLASLLRTELGAALAGFGFLLLGYYVWRASRRPAAVIDSEERTAIRQGYEERFDEPLAGLADMQAKNEILQEAHAEARHVEERVEESRKKLLDLAGAITRQLKGLTGDELREGDWTAAFEGLRRQADELDDEIYRLDIQVERLSVDPSDKPEVEVDVEFDSDRLQELEDERERLEGDLKLARQDLEGLKQRVCQETGDEITESWPRLLANLRERQEEVEGDYRELTAEILAKIGVTQVLEQIRAQEDEKIRQGLRAPAVIELLKKVTGHYESIDMVGDQVIVSGPSGEFSLADLSTGAREQVQLALRMGFAARLTGGDPLFLLLDDAFQHSDWERRGRLVEHVVHLAKSGWQITYLTMDDHLRDLCRAAGEEHFGTNFKMVQFG